MNRYLTRISLFNVSQEDTETSKITTKSYYVSNYDTVEGTFDFKFLGMDANQVGSGNPDNLLVEYQVDEGSWMTATNLNMDGSTYVNNVWYSACFQLNVADASTIVLRWVSGGDSGDNDLVYLDNIVLDGELASETQEPRSFDNECADNTDDWSSLFRTLQSLIL